MSPPLSSISLPNVRKVADGTADLSIPLQSTHKEKDTHQEQRMVSYEFIGYVYSFMTCAEELIISLRIHTSGHSHLVISIPRSCRLGMLVDSQNLQTCTLDDVNRYS